jgi:3-oxoadipate enol-lactonase
MRISSAALLPMFLLETGLTPAQTPSPAVPRGAFVDVDGSRLYYEECGSGPEAVALLHDGVVNSAVWDDGWPAFCQHFHTIRYDRRGYGRSSATKNTYYEGDDLAALLHDGKISHAVHSQEWLCHLSASRKAETRKLETRKLA